MKVMIVSKGDSDIGRYQHIHTVTFEGVVMEYHILDTKMGTVLKRKAEKKNKGGTYGYRV